MILSPILHGGCAAAFTLLAVLVLLRPGPGRAGWLLAGASAATAGWAVAAAFQPLPGIGLGGALELVRGLAWYGFVLHLLLRFAPARTRPVGRVFVGLGLVATLAVGAAVLGEFDADVVASLRSVEIDLRLALPVLVILLVENLYRNVPDDARWHASLPCIALGAMFAYDFLLYADAVLFRRFSAALVLGRPVAAAMVAPLLAVGAARNRRWGINIHVSRDVAFRSASLIVVGCFLVGLGAAGEVLRQFGSDWGLLAEISLVFGGSVAAAVLLASGSMRSRVRALLVDHFYSSRYDYRREWVRCIETLSAPDAYVPLHARAIRAVANVVDSPGGVLFLREAGAEAFRWAGSWNQPAAATPVLPGDRLHAALAEGNEVAVAAPGEPPWVPELPDAWLSVPLVHAGQLLGFILAAQPRAPFKLDREVFGLLRVIGREVAIFLAEQRATERLMQTRELHEFGRRFAFVAHDIKNVSNQLSLLLANAEHHLDNPEFQRDMLVTVRSSVQRITGLLARLKRSEESGERVLVTPLERLEPVVEACRRARGAAIRLEVDGRSGSVVIEPAAFESVVAHLLDNAVEASPPGVPVTVRLRHEGRHVVIDVTDRGAGMTSEFVRDELFRPFVSSKGEGMGLGAYQARELLRAAGGDLLVLSRPGEGTTMRMVLPLTGDPVQADAMASA